jgi:hypothetical protein
MEVIERLSQYDEAISDIVFDWLYTFNHRELTTSLVGEVDQILRDCPFNTHELMPFISNRENYYHLYPVRFPCGSRILLFDMVFIMKPKHPACKQWNRFEEAHLIWTCTRGLW